MSESHAFCGSIGTFPPFPGAVAVALIIVQSSCFYFRMQVLFWCHFSDQKSIENVWKSANRWAEAQCNKLGARVLQHPQFSLSGRMLAIIVLMGSICPWRGFPFSGLICVTVFCLCCNWCTFCGCFCPVPLGALLACGSFGRNSTLTSHFWCTSSGN